MDENCNWSVHHYALDLRASSFDLRRVGQGTRVSFVIVFPDSLLQLYSICVVSGSETESGHTSRTGTATICVSYKVISWSCPRHALIVASARDGAIKFSLAS